MLSRWRKEYQERGEAAFLPQGGEAGTTELQRTAELERFCGQLARDYQVLKKSYDGKPDLNRLSLSFVKSRARFR